MRLNMGTWDRRLRAFLIAPALVVTGLLVGPGGVLSIVLYALAGVMVGTSLVGSCPLYMPFGIKTCSTTQAGSNRNVGAAH